MKKQTAPAKATTKPNLYQTVTDRILASLKEGIIPWEKPWQAPTFPGGNFPRNFRTGKPYRGVNVFLLWSTPYSAPFWLTYKQAQELGGTVRKGEKGTAIVFYKQFSGKKDGTEEAAEQPEGQDNSKGRSPFMLTSYTVFNVEQCDGLKLPEILSATEPNECETDQACEEIVNGWENRPSLQLLSQTERRAYYRPATDSVHMPARFRFPETSPVLQHPLP